MQVDMGEIFKRHIKNFPKKDKKKIYDFISHVQENGLYNLIGKLKPSHEVHKDDPYWSKKVQYAIKHKLWHYHIGIPDYVDNGGYKTSEYVLHFMKFDNRIKIVDMSPHPPFELPKPDYLN